MMLSNSLEGIKVLDLSRLLPGPFCTKILNDLGAMVVKVEDPNLGDYARLMPPVNSYGHGKVFHEINHGKKSICLDLKKEQGKECFYKLVQDHDVLVESFRPGVMESLDLAPQKLWALNKKLIILSLVGYSTHSPKKNRAGHDLNFQAANYTLTNYSRPQLPQIPVADLSGALYGSSAIMAALLKRHRTGQGEHIIVSLEDSLKSLDIFALMGANNILTGSNPCYQIYETFDGKFMALGTLEFKFWKLFCEVVNHPEWIKRHMEENGSLKDDLIQLFKSKTLHQWLELTKNLDICLTAVEFNHQREKAIDELISPLINPRHSETDSDPSTEKLKSPHQGEHTYEYLKQYGYHQEKLDQLQQKGIILQGVRNF